MESEITGDHINTPNQSLNLLVVFLHRHLLKKITRLAVARRRWQCPTPSDV
jgi:hypothetical protein